MIVPPLGVLAAVFLIGVPLCMLLYALINPGKLQAVHDTLENMTSGKPPFVPSGRLSRGGVERGNITGAVGLLFLPLSS